MRAGGTLARRRLALPLARRTQHIDPSFTDAAYRLAKAPQLGRRISCLDALVLEGTINSDRAGQLVMPTGGHGHHGHGGAAAHQRKVGGSPERDDDDDPEGTVGGRQRKLSLLEEEKAEAIGIINQQSTNANDILEQVRRADAAASKVQWFWRFRGRGRHQRGWQSLDTCRRAVLERDPPSRPSCHRRR